MSEQPQPGDSRQLEREDADSDRLVAEAQAGNADSFGTLYVRYFERVHSYFRTVMRDDPEGAEDATQQTFTNAFEALPRYERRGKPFRAWLFAIARNLAIGIMREQGQVEVVDPQELAEWQDRNAEAPDEIESYVFGWLTGEDLAMFVERLPIAQRQVVVLRYLGGFSNGEIAELLDRSPEAVRMLHSRALSFLRDRLEALGRRTERPDSSSRALARVPQARIVRTRRYALLHPGPTA